MPYIKCADYERAARLPLTAGELNYAITLKIIILMEGGSLVAFGSGVLNLCESYITRRGLSYTIGNEVLGVLACSTLETHRRCGDTFGVRAVDVVSDIVHHIYDNILAPYEDAKIKENGDVYPKALVG